MKWNAKVRIIFEKTSGGGEFFRIPCKKTTYVVKNNLCEKQPFVLAKKKLVALAEKTHQTVEGKAPVLRIICKGLENGL